MKLGMRTVEWSMDHPRAIAGAIALVCVVLLALVAAPSLAPKTFGMLSPVQVDTDPENMLRADEPVRVLHDEMKERFALYDMVVLGVVNEKDPQGVFNPETLKHVYELTQYAKTLETTLPDGTKAPMIIERDIIAPSTVDNIEQGGLGTVRFEWLMNEPPKTEEEAQAVRDKAQNLPFLNGTLVSEDGKAVAVYLPLRSKDLSYNVYTALNKKIAEFGDTPEQYHITGLPVAEDVFGVEMFIQMAISAPMAMLVIFLLLLLFFRKLTLIISPMLVAMASVIFTMGLLIATGHTVHIMSSMIPIFIMPIAVLDSVHILSEFFDRYQQTKDRRKTMRHVMETLFMPMLYTSLTSAAGFASLALTPIPPVQTFGIFVGLGVMFAWVLTITLIPAYAMFIPDRKLEGFGATHSEEEESHSTFIGRLLHWLGSFTYDGYKLIIAAAFVAVIVAAYGISLIQVNDNPTKWFKHSHPIRVADKVLNAHFGGTYMGYLALEYTDKPSAQEYLPKFNEALAAYTAENQDMTEGLAAASDTLKQEAQASQADTREALLASLLAYAEKQNESAPSGNYAWDDLITFVETEQQKSDVFKQPETLRYMATLQDAMNTITTPGGDPLVGKSNSLADIVKTVHRELFEGDAAHFTIPDTSAAVAQTLITYESSHRPHDIWHFTTQDYQTANIWVQLKSGDNRDMSHVVAQVEDWMAQNPPPFNLHHDWFGLTYINVIWQEKMVNGMLQAFLGSFLVVLLMMIILFRSALWGLLSMIPLSITIALIYGVIGLVGKDYDMPVAVLSSLTLGLAVDFAIHFLARSRNLYEKYGSWEAAHEHVFGEPARAITRNVLVIAIGFLPLLFAPLVPYITVGVFLASILFVSGAATMFLLPALIRPFEKLLFPATKFLGVLCTSGTCIISGVTFVALVVVNVHQFMEVGWTSLSWASLVALPVLAVSCGVVSRYRRCSPPDSTGM
ncbi:MAG: MMPL family transporter [Candidatus Hydrogenedentes bacterium]|nr:MMPL family transporter [Candidatus Hydrogenedentota bacterium]